MATTTKEILAKLKLDSKEFVGKLSDSHKSVLKLTAGMTAVSAAVVAATKMTANYRDETVKAARAAGSTAEDFSALKYAADLSGVSMEQLSKGLRKLNEPSKEAQAEMARLGVSMRNSSGGMKTQNEMLYDVADAIQGIESPAQKSAAAVAIFGNKGAQMVNLLAGGSEGIKSLTTEAERMGLTFDEKAGAASELFNDNIQRLTGSIQGCVQQLTGGIIEFVNATGIMETLSGAVQAVTGWWKSLDEGTRSMVVTVGAVVAGVAALVLILAGVVAIAPAVTAAVTAMTGGINLIILAVAAAVAAFAMIAVGAVTYWDQVKSAIEPAIDSIKSAVGDLVAAFDPLFELFSSIAGIVSDAFGGIGDDFLSWLGLTEDVTKNMSVLGTVAKVVFAGIGSAIIVVMGAFQTLGNIISLLGTTIYSLGEAFYQAIINQDFNAAKAALGNIGIAAKKLKDDFVGIGDKIKSSFSNIVVTVDPKAAKKGIKDVEDSLNNISGGDGSEPPWIKAMKKYVSSIGGFMTGMASELGKLADLITAPLQAAIERNNYYSDLYTGLYSNMMNDMIAATESAEDEKLAMLEAKYNDQVAAIEDAELRKTAAVEFAANERLLALDAEYQAAREKAEEEYALWIEQEAIKYEAEKEMMLQKSIDKEQSMIVEEIMDNDFKNYLANRQAVHDAAMKQMATDYATKTKATETQLKNDKVALETSSADEIKAITEQKNAALTKAEEDKNTKLLTLQERKDAEEKKMKKLTMLLNWKAEQSMFKQTQGMKIAETMITGIAGAAMAFAMAAGSIPIVGIILGAVLAAAVLGMTIASAAQIGTQQPPPAPAALFLASGGVLSGASHAAGGISAELEGGEGVLDKARTEKFIEAADGISGGGHNMYVSFEPGSIVNNGKEADETLIDSIASALARKLEREGVYA